MRCFECVADKVEKQVYDVEKEAITQYQGTPLCAIHAHKKWKELQEDEKPWYQVMQETKDQLEEIDAKQNRT